MKSQFRLFVSLFGLSAALWLNATAAAEFGQHPELVGVKALGVQTCASSTCHGSSVAFAESNVLQNEYRTWNEQDPHARAYQSLLSPLSQTIARNLNLESAETAAVCLACHSGNSLPAQQRAQTFTLSEGVGCESCHGAAEQYIESHVRGTHQENVKAGLAPLEDPLTRAQLCVSCHVGNSDDRKITHEIMGAGHPRLSFELNTFSSIQPAHYLTDQDYTDRKGKPNAMQMWAIGQLVASEQLLSNVSAFPRAGLFPELTHMDCLGCHQSLNRIDWQRNPLTQGAPGAIRFNDAHLLTSYQLTHAVLPALSPQLLSNIRKFSQTGNLTGDTEEVLANLKQQVSLVRQRLSAEPINAEQGYNLLIKLVESGLQASHQGYGSAEQSAMAINSVVLALNAEQNTVIDETLMQSAIDQMFIALNNPSDYKAAAFINSLKQIRQAINI